MTPSPQLENYFASGGTSGFQARDRANAELAQLRANTAQTGVQTQGLDLENQIKQQTIRDTMAANRAWMGWDGKNPNDLISGVLKNGGSIAAANGLQQKILENQKLKLGNTAEQLAADKGRHDILAGKVQTILQAPPDQQQALYDQYKGQMSGLLDQGEQLPDQFPGTAALTAIKNAHLLESQQNDNALKQQQTATSAAQATASTAAAAKTQAETPGAVAESQLKQAQAAALNSTPDSRKAMVDASIPPDKYPEENKRALSAVENAVKLGLGPNAIQGAIKDSADRIGHLEASVAQAKATQPIKIETAVATQNAAANAAQAGGGLDLMAQQALNGTFTSRNPMLMGRVYARASEMAKEMGLSSQQVVMEQNAAKANKTAFDSVTKQYETLKPFAEMADKNADILEQKSKDISNLGGSFLNTPVRELEGKFGSAKVAAYKATLLPVQADFARILNSPTASGELSDNARHEMQGAIGPGATPQQIKAALDVFRTDAKNRKASYEQALADLKGKTVVGGSTNSSNAGNAGGIPANVKAVLDKVGPGIHTLSDGSKWMKDATGNITKQ